jgi:hypothetical protein
VLFTALVVHITEEAYMLLRRPGSWASASAPINLQGASDSQQPDEPGEILTFGQPERRSRLLPDGVRLPDGIRRPAIATVAAGIIIGGLALAVVAPAHHDAASRASATTRTQQPRAIDVLIASTVSFPVKGTPGALLQVQYLQTGHGPAAIWATLAASGLPQDTSYYTATAGDYAGGRPRILASASSLPDPHTDMLILPLNDLPASVPTEIWIKITNGAGTDLGAARGALLMPGAAGRAVPTRPGRPVCP